MPNVDEHMDDLFRKATGSYPLKTSDSNWDAVQEGLSDSRDEVAAGIAFGNKRGKYFLLFLFLLAGSSLVYYFGTGKNAIPGKQISGEDNINTSHQAETRMGESESKPIAKNTLPRPIPVTVAALKSTPAKSHKTGVNGSLTKRIHYSSNPTGKAPEEQTTSTKSLSARSNKSKARYSQQQVTPAEPATKEKQNNPISRASHKPDTNTITRATIDIGRESESIAEVDQDVKQSKTKPKKQVEKSSAFYVGVGVGIELNKIKNQEMTKVGFNAGIKAGWRLNKLWAAETGLTISRKNYYSLGKYFNPKQGSMPSGMEVVSLEGRSTLLEIPLFLKYNFTANNNTLYTNAGTSSFLLSNEKNDYQAVMSGSPMQMKNTYKQNTFYPFASLNLGLGYQRQLNQTVLRLEPYVQIPFTGIGIGQMPVTSAGLHFYITR